VTPAANAIARIRASGAAKSIISSTSSPFNEPRGGNLGT
jgi:hypothetical protein